jgi:catechol 2,3-dioxygenase-like lactoylglutathione lyase family enzyme
MSNGAVWPLKVRGVDMKLKVVVIPVSVVDRAKRIYGGLGRRLDVDCAFEHGHIHRINFTPPGSPGSGCSVIFGKNVTAAAPGSAQGLYLSLPQNDDIQPPILAADDQADSVGLFLTEIHHRMKNTLTLLGARLRADFRSTTWLDLATARWTAPSVHPWNA